ncbi:TnsD family Tn7-like transposition protein [Paraburkholderia terrae]|uniref:TnsD family Tn7-like transposition protein n=1 Tax=Paraburkholderia terrae TaxID=311230 RepID=UPI00296B2DCA|nr:TnsD family Tn7-like transposition protein [Paraburkholderia terrae]MDW3662552.1 TnsD family Tn7-like transposition protein [Paraburkholderia terrae]
MPVYLSRPGPDEPLFGVVAHYGKVMAVGNWKGFIASLFGYNARFNSGLAYNLDQVALQTTLSMGMTALEIVEQMTLFPYYAAFCGENLRKRILERMLVWRPEHLPGDILKLVQRPKVLRYCKASVDQDRREEEAIRWRRCHQLPGVFCCPQHADLLYEVSLAGRTVRVWPALLDVLAVNSEQVQIAPVRKSVIQEVAELSASILLGGERDQGALFSIERSWNQIARDCGYARGRRTLESAQICKEMIELFGEDYLGRCAALPESDQNWIVGRLQGTQTASRSLPEILLSIFFKSRENGSTGHWPFCPSQFASHGSSHRVEVRVTRNSQYFCYCSCGMSFVESRQLREIQKSTVSVYGEPYVIEARRLAALGYSGAEIARRLGTSESTARRLMRRAQQYANRSIARTIAEAAVGWSDALGAQGGNTGAQKAYDGLYRRMRRFCPEKLDSTATDGNISK